MKTKTSAISITAFLLLAPLPARSEEPVKSTSSDLNGDGKPEAISLQWDEDAPQYVLKVGNATVRGKSQNTEVRGVTVVDLDSGDKWKEIAVHMGLNEGDTNCTLYGFDGQSLKELGNVHALSEVRGNGIVLSDTWTGFWNRREKYVLDHKAWKLNHVPQDLYYVGAEATVKQSFPLMYSRTDKTVVANLAQNSKIQVLVAEPVRAESDLQLWYLVKSSTGLVGWVRTQDLAEKTEGLSWAG